MPCATCGCSCCQTMMAPHQPFTIVDYGKMGTFAGVNRMQRVMVIDVAAEERSIASMVELMMKRLMVKDRDPRTFHQQLNRKPWERRA